MPESVGFCIYPGDKKSQSRSRFRGYPGIFSSGLKQKVTVSNPRYRDLGSRKNPILKPFMFLVILSTWLVSQNR